jgi:hypothetical protein
LYRINSLIHFCSAESRHRLRGQYVIKKILSNNVGNVIIGRGIKIIVDSISTMKSLNRGIVTLKKRLNSKLLADYVTLLVAGLGNRGPGFLRQTFF